MRKAPRVLLRPFLQKCAILGGEFLEAIKSELPAIKAALSGGEYRHRHFNMKVISHLRKRQGKFYRRSNPAKSKGAEPNRFCVAASDDHVGGEFAGKLRSFAISKLRKKYLVD